VLAAAHITAEHPLAHADAFAAALAANSGSTLVTGDREFKTLEDIVRVHWLQS
jgi:ribonuclease VapC